MEKLYILKNGLKLAVKDIPYLESISIIIWVKIGSRYESKNINGISHLIEHLLFKGTKKRKNALSISLAIEEIGGKINAFTSEEYTGFYVKVPTKYMELGLDVLSDMIYNPLFKKEDILKEKQVVFEEIKRYYDIPEEWADTLLDKAIWGDHPLGRDILGTIESVESIRRADMFEYLNKFYVPENITVSISGKMDIENTKMFVEKYFPSKKGEISQFTKVEDEILGDKIVIEKRSINQSHLSLAFLSFSRSDRRRYILTLLSIILGSGMSSRLFQKIREEKGIVYDIGTYPAYFLDTGILKIYAGIDPSKTREAILEILKELKKAKLFDSEKELNKAKEYYKGSFFINLEDSLSQASFIGKWTLFEGKLPKISEFIENIEKVTVEDIREVANYLFSYKRGAVSLIIPDDLSLDRQDIEEFLNLVND